MQVLYLGRAPHTKETLPDFLKWCRVTRHPLVFRGFTGSQRTPGIGASHRYSTLEDNIRAATQTVMITSKPAGSSKSEGKKPSEPHSTLPICLRHYRYVYEF